MGDGYGNPPDMFEPPTGAGDGRSRHKKRRWIVHSHEATQPEHADAMSDINITPLIDVMLVLLIIFMVVTPLAQKGLDIALPQATPNQPGHAQPQHSNQVVLGLERRAGHDGQQEPGGEPGRAGPRGSATSSRPAPTRRSS